MSELLGDNPLPSFEQAEFVGRAALLPLPLFDGVKPGGDFPTGGAHPDPETVLAPPPETTI